MQKSSLLIKIQKNLFNVENRIAHYLFLFIVYFILCFFTYFELLGNSFLADDYSIITRVSSKNNLFTGGEFFRPLVLYIWKFFHVVFGNTHTSYYYIFSLIMLSFIGVSIFVIVKTFFRFLISCEDSNKSSVKWFYTALLSPVIFIFHFRKTEAVCWLSDWYYLFAALFILLSLIYYFKYKINLNKKRYLILLMLFYTAAFLSHELAFPVFILFLILDIYNHKKESIRQNTFKVFIKNNKQIFIYLAMVFCYFGVRYLVVGGAGGYSHITFKDYFNISKIHNFLGLVVPPVHFIDNKLYFIPLGIIVSGSLVVFIYGLSTFLKKSSLRIKFSRFYPVIFILLSTLVFLFPILSMHVPFTGILQDRVLFVSIIFISILLSYALVSLIQRVKKKMFAVVGAAAFILSLFLYTKITLNNTYIPASLIKNDFETACRKILFTNETNRKYILLYPDNYNQAYVLRNAVQILPISKTFIGNIRHFYGFTYHFSSSNNVVSYEKQNDMIKLQVKNLAFNQPEEKRLGYRIYSSDYVLFMEFNRQSNVKVLIYNIQRRDFDVYSF